MIIKRPLLPPAQPLPPLPQPILPPLPSEPPAVAPQFPQMRVFVRAIRITGSTVFSQEDLAQVTAPYVNRELTTEDLEALRLALTRLYINAGGSDDPRYGRCAGWPVRRLVGAIPVGRRLTDWGLQALTRLDVQLASAPLLPLEQIAVGGRYSVRGYRENQLVRDNGVIGSVEARVPVVRNVSWADVVELASFMDAGTALLRRIR